MIMTTVMAAAVMIAIMGAIIVLMEELIVSKTICNGWIWYHAIIMVWDIAMTTYHKDLQVLVPVYQLIAKMITMMILCLIAIQCGNDYTSMYLWMYFMQFTILCMYFDVFLPMMRVFFCFCFMFSVLGDMFWTVIHEYLCLYIFFKDLLWFFFRFFELSM